jgi:hypothetical protein
MSAIFSRFPQYLQLVDWPANHVYLANGSLVVKTDLTGLSYMRFL